MQQQQQQDVPQASGSSSAVEVPMVFWCKIDNVRVVTTVLSTIHLKKETQLASVTITRAGVRFTVEEARVFQANAFMAPELFQEYHFADAAAGGSTPVADGTQQQYTFRVNFSVLMECLSIFNASTAYTAMQMGYAGYGTPLVLLLEESGVRTECRIRTLEPEEPAVIAFSSSQLVADIIVGAELLKDAFADLDWSSATARLLVSPDKPFFRLATEGAPGSLEVTYPNQADVFESFHCTRTLVSRYGLTALQPTVRALAIARKTRLCINAAGMLSMQHMVQTEDRKTSFVDFLLLPEVDDDDADAGDDNPSAAAVALNMVVDAPK